MRRSCWPLTFPERRRDKRGVDIIITGVPGSLVGVYQQLTIPRLSMSNTPSPQVIDGRSRRGPRAFDRPPRTAPSA